MFKIEDFNILEVRSQINEVVDWGLQLMNIPEWWKQTQGENITVAVIDTGYEKHIDLEGNVINCYNTIENDTIDRVGHGNFCLSIIGAMANQKGIIGVAPKSKLVSIKALDRKGSGTLDSLTRALQIAINNKYDIVSMSLGAPRSQSSTILENMVKTAVDRGIILVSAAGNESFQEADIPAYYDGVIGVAAIDKSGNKASFSNFGAGVDIAAPGVDIFGCGLNNQWIRMSGSSMSTPMIAGLCALILSKHRANPNSQTPIKNGYDMLDHLKRLTDSNNVLSNIGYGVPKKVELTT